MRLPCAWVDERLGQARKIADVRPCRAVPGRRHEPGQKRRAGIVPALLCYFESCDSATRSSALGDNNSLTHKFRLGPSVVSATLPLGPPSEMTIPPVLAPD